jgi:hypothetical protein
MARLTDLVRPAQVSTLGLWIHRRYMPTRQAAACEKRHFGDYERGQVLECIVNSRRRERR